MTASLRLGLASGAFFPVVLTEDSIDAASELGISDVELMLQTRSEYQTAFARTLANRTGAHEISIHAIHAMQHLHPVLDPYRRRSDEGWEMFERTIETCQRLGTSIVVWHGPCTRNQPEEPSFDQVAETIDRLAGMCAPAGITLAIENVSWCVMSSVRDVARLSTALPELPNGGNIGFTFDPFQAAEAKANPFMILNAMGDRLVDVHLRDHDPTAPARRALLPGDGALPWPALIRAVFNAGYEGPMMIEGSLGEDPTNNMVHVRETLQPLIDASQVHHSICSGPLPPGLLEGIRLFNAGDYYEAHEEIEHEWHAERGEIRRLYQGILQIGVGFHHTRGGNYRGANALLTDGIEKVSRFLPRCRGVETAQLARQSQVCLETIRDLGPDDLASFDWETVPTIDISGN